METIFDLPAHPLMVHFPVVAIPLLAVLGLVMAARPKFRDQYALPIIGLGVVTVIATFVAAKSGEELVESLGLKDDFIDPHRDLGSTLRFFVLGLTVAIVGMVAVNKRASATKRDPAAVVSSVLVVALALLSLVWTVRTGHEGAKAVWGTGEAASSSETAEVASIDTTAAPSTTATSTTEAPAGETSESTDPPQTTQTTVPPESTETTETTATTEGVEPAVNGQEVFESNCARCHSADGSGGRGPSLQGLAIEQPDQAGAIAQVTNGGRRMPSFGDKLETDEIQAAVDYIYTTF
jgi:mono/diheme cytochrome c family protein